MTRSLNIHQIIVGLHAIGIAYCLHAVVQLAYVCTELRHILMHPQHERGRVQRSRIQQGL